MASKMYNRARMTVTSTGTGALSLGTAVAGYQTFSSSGAQNGDTVSYTIEDGVNWEVGTGTFNSVAGTLSRTVTQSFNGTTYGTSAISVTTNAQVYITALAADIVVSGGALGTPSSGTLTNATGLPLATGVTGTLPVSNGGTGLTSLTAGYIPYGNGTGAFGNSANFYYDGANVVATAPAGVSRFRLVNGTDVADFAYAGSNLYLSSSSAGGSLILQTANTERMRVASDGTVGIGLTNPGGYKLNVNGTIYASGGSLCIGSGGYYQAGSIYADASWGMIFRSLTANGGGQGAEFMWANSAGTERMRLDSAGNLGLGVTPSAWGGGGKVVELGGAGNALWYVGSNDFRLNANVYFNGSNYIYGAAQPASYYRQAAGAHQWYSAASGTANSIISFTQAMTLDGSGNLLVGTTTYSASTNANYLMFNPVYGQEWISHASGTVSGTAYTNYTYNGTTIGYINQNGTTGVLYNTSSDISLKTKITEAVSALASVLALPIRQFDWKSDGSHTDYGVVAQEANDYAPEMVTQGDIWSVDYGRITPRLIKAFQELAAKVSALEAKQ